MAVLVKEAQAGDREAFEELVRLTGRAVYSRIYLDTGDAHQAEDLAQETFLRAWRGLTGLKNREGFLGWLFTVAQSVTTDSLRRRGRQRRKAPGWESAEALEGVAGGADGAAEAQRRERREQVRLALQALPEPYRAPLTLRYIGGADYVEIKRQLALTNGSLRGLLHRGLQLFRKSLEGTEVSQP